VGDYAGANSLRRGRQDELALHPTVKPVAMVADAIKDCSHRNGIVLDPFGGSGTTLIAAERAGRRGYLLQIGIQASRENEETLAQQRRLLGRVSFEAQNQQKPVPASGNVIKREWLRDYDTAPLMDLTMVSRDTASTLGETSDYSAGTVWGLKGSDIYLLDLVRGKFEVPELHRRLEALHLRHNANATLIEETDIGRAIEQGMRFDRKAPFRPILSRPRYDKQTRISQEAAKFEAGRALLPREAPWLACWGEA